MASKFREAMARRSRTILNGIRVRPNEGKASEAGFDSKDEISQIIGEAEAASLTSINQFRELSSNRCEQYDAYDEMEKDASISAALKMYADDATQYNLEGEVVWAESEDPTIAEFANRLLRVLKINDNAWSHIYNLVKYGDIYLETFYDDEDDGAKMPSKKAPGFGTTVSYHKYGAHIEEYVEMVHDPAIIFELKRKGKTCGFLKMADINKENSNISTAFSINLAGTEQQILPSDKYVHILLSEDSNRFPETVNIQVKSGEDPVNIEYTVNKGKSLLQDAFKSYRELKLMEDSVLLNRVTRSAITRILQIEVGDMPKQQVREKLRQVKMMIEQKNFMDKSSGDFNNMASPGPVDNVVYVPTRNGNGAISSSTIGGDVDPKSLADIEYYQQKEAGGLGVPLSYLAGTSGDGGGLSSGTALTKLDNRYARAVKRIQNSYISGIQTLINIFAVRKGFPQYVNEFKIRMLSPSTIEDSDRDEQLNNRIGMLNDLLSMLQDSYSEKTVKEVTEFLVSTFLNKPEVASILSADDEEGLSDSEEDADEEEPFDNSIGGFHSSSFEREPITDFTNDAVDIEPINSEEIADEPTEFGDFEEFA